MTTQLADRQSITQPMTFERLARETDEFNEVEICIAGPDFRRSLSGPEGLMQIAKIEFDSRLVDCDECTDGMVEVDRGSYTSHSTNQVFEAVHCPKCGGSKKYQMPIAILIPQQ